MTDLEPKTSIVDLDALKKCLEVEVPGAVVTAGLDRAFNDLQRRVRLRGFRPGKAPRAVLERLYGKQVRGEVIDQLVRDAYALSISRHGIQVVGPPTVEVQPLNDDNELRFSATVEVYPEVSVSSYEGIEVTRTVTDVDEQAVDAGIARMAEAAATIHPVTDRDRLEAGDVATVDIAAKVEGRQVGDLRKGVMIEAGKGAFSGALEEQVVGLAVGTTTVDVDYPSDYPNTAFAGKRVSFKVSVLSIGRKEIPALDDDFARTYGDCPSYAALREKVRGSLERDAEHRADAAVREAVMDALIERHPFDAPEAIVDLRCEGMIESLNLNVPPGSDGQKALSALREELRPRAVRDGKAAILLDSLAAQQGLELGDDELAGHIDRIVEGAGEARTRARELYENDERRQALRTQLLREKAMALVVSKSNILTVEKR